MCVRDGQGSRPLELHRVISSIALETCAAWPSRTHSRRLAPQHPLSPFDTQVDMEALIRFNTSRADVISIEDGVGTLMLRDNNLEKRAF